MTDLNTSTEATITDETAIGFIPCYRLPFLSLFHADCMEIMKLAYKITNEQGQENLVHLTNTHGIFPSGSVTESLCGRRYDFRFSNKAATCRDCIKEIKRRTGRAVWDLFYYEKLPDAKREIIHVDRSKRLPIRQSLGYQPTPIPMENYIKKMKKRSSRAVWALFLHKHVVHTQGNPGPFLIMARKGIRAILGYEVPKWINMPADAKLVLQKPHKMKKNDPIVRDFVKRHKDLFKEIIQKQGDLRWDTFEWRKIINLVRAELNYSPKSGSSDIARTLVNIYENLNKS